MARQRREGLVPGVEEGGKADETAGKLRPTKQQTLTLFALPTLSKPSKRRISRTDPRHIEPPWQAVKEWIADDEPDLDWFNRPRNPSNPDPDGLDQRPSWRPREVLLEDGRILVLDDT